MNTELPEDQKAIQADIKALVEEKMLDWTDEEYFNDRRFVTNSMLTKIKQGGVQHLQAYLEGRFDSKKHDQVGKHFHCIVLEPHKEEERFYVIDDRAIVIELSAEFKSPRATKKYKEWLQDNLKNAGGREIIEWEDYDNNIRMKEKLLSYKPIRDLVQNKNNVFEKIFYGKNQEYNIDMKCMCDIRNYGNYIADLKSTKDPVTPGNVMSIIRKYGYHRQAATYLEITGEEQFFFIFVEKTYPFTCGIVEISQSTLKEARQENDSLLKTYIKYFGVNCKVKPEDDFLMFTV